MFTSYVVTQADGRVIVPALFPITGFSKVDILGAWYKSNPDRLMVGWLNGVGGVPREHKMLKGHLPRVMYHQVC